VPAFHRRTVLLRDPLARRTESALNATQRTVSSWPAGSVRAIIMGLGTVGREGAVALVKKGGGCAPLYVSRPVGKTFAQK
jgi:hypothetical protein